VITLVVFSKDRAMQLDSLLQSVKDNCTGIDRVVAIVDASSDLHERAYDLLPTARTTFAMLRQKAVGGLGVVLAAVLKRTEYIALAVDDQLFYASSNFKKAAFSLEEHLGFVWSWRLGLPTVHNRCACPFDEADPHWLVSALDSDPNYGYLWHTDGSLYKTADYVKMLDTHLPDWRTGDYTPNDLEGRVATQHKLWAPHVGPHLGPIKPTCITWQLNLARRNYASGSPAFELPETRLDVLAQAYLDGKRVDNEKLYAALQENPLRFNQDGDRPTHVRACEEASRFWAECVR
jgi:hypothetical protein